MRTLQALLTISILSIFIGCNRKMAFEQSLENKSTLKIDIPSNLKNIIIDLEKGKSIESSYIGYQGLPSDQWDKYEQLKKVATIDQLITLTNYQNPIVSSYAFQALAAKNSDKVFPLLLKHLNDTTTVKFQNGCTIHTGLTTDYFIDIVTTDNIEEDTYKLNLSERKILDSILLNDKSIKLYARHEAIRNIKPTTENYEIIRQLVKNEKNHFALISLAKYQKDQDKELIASFFENDDTQYTALCAVQEFPHDYLYNFVTNIFEQEWKEVRYDYSKWRACYQALARYPRPETVELFERTTNIDEEFRYETLCKYLLIAITKYPNKLYEPLKSRIKLDSYQLEEVKNALESNY